jgi:hypothetical protein
MLGVIISEMRRLARSHSNVKRLQFVRTYPTSSSLYVYEYSPHLRDGDGCRKPADPFAYYSPGSRISIIRGISCISLLLIMNGNENRPVKSGFP